MANRMAELSDEVSVLSDLFALPVFDSLSDVVQDELKAVHARLKAELDGLAGSMPRFSAGIRVTQ